MIVTYALTGSLRRVTPERKRHVVERIEVDDRTPLGRGLLDQHRQPPDRLRADDDVGDAGRALQDRLAFLLRHAAGDGDDRVVALLVGQLPQLAEPRVELVLGALAHAAGVDDDDVGVGGVVGRLVARPARAARPSARSRGRSSGSRTSRSGICAPFATTFAFRLSLSPVPDFRLSPSRAVRLRRPDRCSAFERSASISRADSPKAIADRFPAEHPRQLLDPPVRVEPADRGARPAALDPLLDLEVRVGVRGNLRQVRDAEHLERRPERRAACGRRRRRPARRCRRRPRRRSGPGADALGGRSAASLNPWRVVAVSVLIASMMRESSPPETMRASGRRSSPGFGETKNSAASMPARRSTRPPAAARRRSAPRSASAPSPAPRAALRAALANAGRDAAPFLRQLLRPPPRNAARAAASSRSSSAIRSSPPSRVGQLARAARRGAAMTSASVGPYFRFSRSSSASRSSTCCSRAGDASMPSAYLRRNAGQILELRLDAVARLEVRLELRVERRPAPRRGARRRRDRPESHRRSRRATRSSRRRAARRARRWPAPGAAPRARRPRRRRPAPAASARRDRARRAGR